MNLRLRARTLLAALISASIACDATPPASPTRSPQSAPPPRGAAAPEAVSATPEEKDPIIARAGEAQVRLSDYDRGLRRMALFSPTPEARALPQALIQAPHFQHTTALNLLSILMLRQEARRRGLATTQTEREDALRADPQLSRLAPLEPQAQELLLAEFGLTTADLWEVVDDQILRRALSARLLEEVTDEALWRAWRQERARTLMSFVAVPNTPSAEALTAYVKEHAAEIDQHYQDHPQEFMAPAARRVRIIQRALAPDATQAQREEARALLERLRARAIAGEDFAALAREHSQHPSAPQGGDLGFVVRQQRPEAFALPLQEPGEVQERPQGLSVLWVERELPARQQELTPGLRREIAATLLRKQGPQPEPLALARQIAAAWAAQPAPAPVGAELQALLDGAHLRQGKSLPFPNDAPPDAFLPGIGASPALRAALDQRSASAPIHPEPLLFQDQLYVIALLRRDETTRAEFEANKEEFRRRWRAAQAETIAQDLIEARQRELGVALDLQPVTARYGTLRQKPGQAPTPSPAPPSGRP